MLPICLDGVVRPTVEWVRVGAGLLRFRYWSRDRLRKARLSFYAEPEDYAALKALSARTGVPQQV